MNCSLPGCSVHGILQARILEWQEYSRQEYYSLLQGIFPTQGWNPGLLCCRQILYHLSHQGRLGVLSTFLIYGIITYYRVIGMYTHHKLRKIYIIKSQQRRKSCHL